MAVSERPCCRFHARFASFHPPCRTPHCAPCGITGHDSGTHLPPCGASSAGRSRERKGVLVSSPTRDARTSNKQQLVAAIPVPYLWLGWSTMAPEYHGLISAGEIAPWS